MLPESTSVLPEAAPHRGPRLRALLKARYGTIALAAALVGCGSGNDAPSGPIAPPPPPPPLPAVGDLRVIVTTTGEDADPDGYTLTLDETETRTIGINTTTTFVGLSPGSHSVRLDGIAHNCAAEGTNPVSAQVNQGETASVSLDVGCLFIEGELDFDIADNVPGSAVTVIQAGLDLAEAYLETDYGGGISRRVRDTLTVKIVATGQATRR